jgi:uncharacterized protein (DUF4415 family)
VFEFELDEAKRLANIEKHDEEEGEIDWENAIPVSIILDPKRQITIRLDQDVLDWFKSGGEGYQTRINAVLRSYVDAQKQAEAKDEPAARRKAS